jgi:hypothetical protein
MEAVKIKEELHAMINQESDVKILEAILAILQKTTLDPILRQKLTNRALKSEESISQGKVISLTEVKLRTQR